MELLPRLALALGLGLLVGLQRQHAEARLAGIRTFPLITVLGAVATVLAQSFGGLVLAAAWLGIVALSVIGNLLQLRGEGEREVDVGMTTEAAMLLMFGVGALTIVAAPWIATIAAGSIAVLLHAKEPLHRAVKALGDHDFKAIFQFVLLSLVILPLVPDRNFGPYDVLNPRNIWLMVVLIVGLGLIGYLSAKFLGEKRGSVISGLLGGLVSSTATTLSFARAAAVNGALIPLAAVIIPLAGAVVFLRVLVEVAVVAPATLKGVGWPLGLMVVVAALLAWPRRRPEAPTAPPVVANLQNPSELVPALLFGGLYALVSLAVAATRDFLGDGGLYVVAFVSGLTDLDAITLSTAALMKQGSLETVVGWRLIVIASLANLLFKIGVVFATGPRELFRKTGPRLGLTFAAGVALIALWPA